MSQDAETLTIKCPFCEGQLVVDRQTGAILESTRHEEPHDFDTALQDVNEGEQRRSDDFMRAFNSEKDREETLLKQFERAREKTRGDDSRPRNPLDEL